MKHQSAILVAFLVLLQAESGLAAPIPFDVSISTEITYDTEYSFSDPGASHGGTMFVRTSGFETRATFSDGTVVGPNPLTGTLTDTGDGLGVTEATDSAVGAGGAEIAVGVDMILTLTNASPTDTYEIVFAVTHTNIADANQNGNSFLHSEFTIDEEGGEIFFSHVESDVLFGDELNGIPQGTFGAVEGDWGNASLTVTLAPGATIVLEGDWTMSAETFSVVDAFYGRFEGNVVVSEVNNLTNPPMPADVELANLVQGYDGAPKVAMVTTDPPGLAVDVTYNGSPSPPVNAGSYAVVAIIDDPVFFGSATGTLVVQKAPASVNLGSLQHVYDGSPKAASAITNPPGLTVQITYNGSSTPPTDAGSYEVRATIDEPNFQGGANGTLVIAKAPGSVLLVNLVHTYDGTGKAAASITNPLGLAVDITYDGSPALPTEAGSYEVIGTINERNYEGSATEEFVIERAQAAVLLSDLEHFFDGSRKSASVITLPPGLTVEIRYDGSPSPPSAVGSYEVIANVVGEPNYMGGTIDTLFISQGPLAMTEFNYDPSSGQAEVSFVGKPDTKYRLRQSPRLDFGSGPEVILSGATVGTLDGNGVLTDPSGDATVQFATGFVAQLFVRVEEP